MDIKVTYTIPIDEKKYPNLKKKEIREIVKSYEQAMDCRDYILNQAENEIFELALDKTK